MRKGLVGLLAVIALGGCSAEASAETIPVASPPKSAYCRSAELTASLRDSGTLVLHNDTRRPCLINGTPTISYVVSEDGLPVGAALTTTAPADVTVVPGGTATAHLERAAVITGPACTPVKVAGLRVELRGQGTPLFVEEPGKACAATGLLLGAAGPLITAPSTSI